MEEKIECPFFKVCAAYIIRDKMQDQESFEILVRKKMVVNLPKWSEQFCFNDFENCVHYQDRIQIKN